MKPIRSKGMEMRIKSLFLISVISLAVLLSAACSAQAEPVYAVGDAKDKAVATAAPIAQDILDGIQKKDFSLYSKDFNAAMLKASTQDSFDKMVAQFAAFGEFKSSDLINVQIVSTYYRVNYKLTFANKVLTMGVVIPNDGTAAVTGLWFK
jgi:hypothetical protein